jgi:hypothetical protein
MAKVSSTCKPSSAVSAPITKVAVTDDTLSGRGGLAVFSQYLRSTGIVEQLEGAFGALRKNRKGLSVGELFHQILCFLMDGTSRHLTYFDAVQNDEGYARGIETAPERMASSHAVKRFFGAFGWGMIWQFRRVLLWLLLWRLKQEQPEVIVLGMDTMVMDNDEAEARQGCQPTYKKVKGFQPLQLTWGSFVVDALFRGGKKNGNAGDMASKLVGRAVAFIRKHYREDVPIIVRMDAGFFDQKLLRAFEKLGIGVICSGKLLDDITGLARQMHPSAWVEYDNGRQLWQYFEFGDRRKSWKPGEWLRAFYTRPAYEDEQRLLEFARPDNVIYTNIGKGGRIDAELRAAGCADWLRPEKIIELHHDRGSDELVHRALKEFRAEQLPFKNFQANAAFYYTALVAFFLFETFKRDVTAEVVPITARATRVRREAIDFAAKIVRHGGETVLKVTAAVWERLRIAALWSHAAQAPAFTSG